MLEIKLHCDVCGTSAQMKDYKEIKGWFSLGFNKHLCPVCYEKWGKKDESPDSNRLPE